MKPFLTVQTRLWAEWTEGSKQTKLGRTRSSPEESVPEAIRPSRRTFHLFSWFILFQKLHNQALFPLLSSSYPLFQGEERGRARQEGGRWAGEVVSVGEVWAEDITFLFANCLHQYYQLILSEVIPVIEVPRADDIFLQTVTILFFRFRKQAEQMESFHRAEVCW